jgi:hypothetical protein
MALTVWLAAMPLWLSTILVVGVPTLIAMAGCYLVRRVVALDKLSTNNEVAGFKFAVVGVLYAVLLGFVVIVVWEKFRDAEASVIQEAGDVASLYRLSDALDGDRGHAVRVQLGNYLRQSIDLE